MQLLVEQTMARPKGRPKTDRVYASVKIEVGVLNMARMAAKAENQTTADWITNTLGPIAKKRVGELAAKLSKEPLK